MATRTAKSISRAMVAIVLLCGIALAAESCQPDPQLGIANEIAYRG